MVTSVKADTHTAPCSDPASGDVHPARWRMLGVLAASELLGMSLWFAASAVAPQLGARWSLTPSQVGWLTAIVQLGFVLGTAISAILNLADIIPSRLLFPASALLGSFANTALLFAPGYGVA